MITSRNIDDLVMPAKAKVSRFLGLCRANNIDVIITSTYRDFESQDALYAQGRTTSGNVVTNAKGGKSFHNFRCAIDVVPVVNGKCDWDGTHAVWATLGKLGKEAGLEWAGEWKSFKEMAHFQYTGGLTLDDLNSGKQIV
jgi:peptidoglycan L-alanyl-D-glutamate endopeptidase CwlK